MFEHPALPVTVVAAVGTIVTLSAVIDYRERRIPNYITVPAALLGLAYAFVPGWIGPVSAMLGLLIGFGLLLLPWVLGGGGMGDVKLLAALGAWLGPVYILAAFALATVVASFMAVGVLLYHMLATGMTSTKQTYLATAGGQATSKPAAARRVLPFAVPLGVSTWLVLLWLLARQQGS